MLVKLLYVVEIVMHTVHAVVCSDIYYTFLYHQPLYGSCLMVQLRVAPIGVHCLPAEMRSGDQHEATPIGLTPIVSVLYMLLLWK